MVCPTSGQWYPFQHTFDHCFSRSDVCGASNSTWSDMFIESTSTPMALSFGMALVPVILLLLAAPTWLWVTAAETILLQPVLSWTSSFVVPMALKSRLTQSIHLCFGIPLFLLPGGTISRVFLPTYSWSRLSTFSFFVMSSFLTWYISVWPHAHLRVS